VSLLQDLAIDKTGRLFVPAIWGGETKGGRAGRRLAVDEDGAVTFGIRQADGSTWLVRGQPRP
jgi:hypothetical protein